MRAMDCSVLRLSMVFLSLVLRIHGKFPSGDFISWGDFSAPVYLGSFGAGDGAKDRVIVVSKDGKGHSDTVQGGVDMVPHGNTERVKIVILPGVYREKVLIPCTKPYVSFIGNQSSETVISWHSYASEIGSDGRPVGTDYSATVIIESDFFCAAGITFENTAPMALPGALGKQAVALRVSGDRAMFYRCRILGFQDTLFDQMGRHYFLECYIRGSIDFIFGSARSLYKACIIDAVASGFGAIAASQRNSPSEDTGFSFFKCKLTGSGAVYLGRAWGSYATVVYSYCQFEDIVIPTGWSDWGDPSRRRTTFFAEFRCHGSGAHSSQRVSWVKTLTYEEAKPFLDMDYIDGSQWLQL